VKSWFLRSAKALVIREPAVAEHSEMQALRHLRNAVEECVHTKTELGERGANIAGWSEKNLPGHPSVARPTCRGLQELAKLTRFQEMGRSRSRIHIAPSIRSGVRA
jgi:hypothetical protein